MGLYDEVKQIVGADILEIFGDSGSGKSSFARVLVDECIAAGKKVYYIDSERNIKEPPSGIGYEYVASLDSMYNTIMMVPREQDLVILDSLGLPILGEFASMDMRGRGAALLKAEAICYKLKQYTWQNTNALTLVLNQPESQFGKEPDYIRQPFCDKHVYFIKEIWVSKMFDRSSTSTICQIFAFRSRIFPNKLLYTINISGPTDNIKINITKQW